MPRSAPDPCPCGRRDLRGAMLAYAGCCGRYLDDFAHSPAPDAESLMRSRYTAFVREQAHYLLATWHPSHRPDHLDFEPGAKWLGLEVRAHAVVDADHAEVESWPAGAAALARPTGWRSAAASCVKKGREASSVGTTSTG